MQLVHDMAQHSQQLNKVGAWAERLQQNILEEHSTYLQSVAAGYLGVRSNLGVRHAVWSYT